MMNRLWVRLSLAFLVVAWLGIGAVALIVEATTEHSFRQYVNRRESSFFDAETVAQFEQHYASTGSWAGAEALLPGPRGGGEGARARGRGGAQILLADADGIVVAATDPERVGTALDETLRRSALSLEVDGVRVGWLAQSTPGTQALGQAEQDFLAETTVSLVAAAIGAALLSVVVGGVLAWQLTRPMRALTAAAHDLAAGELGRQVKAQGTTEMVELAQAFNSMSRDLAAGEALRRRMAADIAHELRTPVSVLRGHLEAMLDGVFPLDAGHLAVAYDRTIHLARLVDDLRLLTRAEAGNLPLERTMVAPGDLVARAIESFAPLALDSQIGLEHTVAPGLPLIHVDADRIQQVLGNLLANALRHTPTGGRISLRVTLADRRVRFAVTNTGAGLTPEQAANVFTPFWRADEAHERDPGGSGLGLAIAQQLLALHGGRIWVETAPDVTTFVFELPAHAGPPA